MLVFTAYTLIYSHAEHNTHQRAQIFPSTVFSPQLSSPGFSSSQQETSRSFFSLLKHLLIHSQAADILIILLRFFDSLFIWGGYYYKMLPLYRECHVYMFEREWETKCLCAEHHLLIYRRRMDTPFKSSCAWCLRPCVMVCLEGR